MSNAEVGSAVDEALRAVRAAVEAVVAARQVEEVWARGALGLQGFEVGDELPEQAAEAVYRAAVYGGKPAEGLPDWSLARHLLPVVYADDYACRVLVPSLHLSGGGAIWRLERRPLGPMPWHERELRSMVGELVRMREAVELTTLEGELVAVGLPARNPLAATALVLYASPVCRARTGGLLRWRGHFAFSAGSKLDRAFPHRRRLLAPPDWLALDYHDTPEAEFEARRAAYIGRAEDRFEDGLCVPSPGGFARRPMLPDPRYACWLTLRVVEVRLPRDTDAVAFVAAFEAMGPERQWVGTSEAGCVESIRRAFDALTFTEDYFAPGRPPIETLGAAWAGLGSATYVDPRVFADSPTRTYLVGVRVGTA